MAGLDDLKDQLRERSQMVWERIQESSIYNNLRDKYDSWPPLVQKSVLAGAAFAAVLFLLSIPYSFLDSASQHVTDFEERRGLIRALLKTARSGRDMNALPSGPSPQALRSQVESVLKAGNLIPEQIAGISEADISETRGLIPSGISQTALSVQLKKLNVRQITDLGYEMGRIHQAVKLISLEVNASRELKNYYDATYKLVSFAFPYGSDGGGGMGGDSDGQQTEGDE